MRAAFVKGSFERVPRAPARRACSRALFAIAALCAWPTFARVALACPSCEAGIRARSEVWSDGFAAHFAIALLPFLVIGLVCFYAESIGRPRGQRRKRSASARP
jgi:hypothetical protein